MVLMLLLAVPGAALLFGGPYLARHLVRDGGDTRALARAIQGVGVALLIAALLAGPNAMSRERPVSRTEDIR